MSREGASPEQFDAARVALAEVSRLLEMMPLAVIVGGSVPYLLIHDGSEAHEGTVDIDVVLARDQPGADDVLTLHEMLERLLFQQDRTHPFRYTKVFVVNGQPRAVLLELLAGGEPTGTGLLRIPTEDVWVSIIPGMEVALHLSCEALVPGGVGRKVRVASMPALFAMKAVALDRRDPAKKAKDAYDIVYCLRNYPGGSAAIAREIVNHISNPQVAYGVELLRKLFVSTEAIGPKVYAERADDPEGRALLQREAFERVSDLLASIDSVV